MPSPAFNRNCDGASWVLDLASLLVIENEVDKAAAPFSPSTQYTESMMLTPSLSLGSEIVRPCEDDPLPGLRAWLQELDLDEYHGLACQWVEEQGAAWLEEIVDNAHDFASCLNLNPWAFQKVVVEGHAAANKVFGRAFFADQDACSSTDPPSLGLHRFETEDWFARRDVPTFRLVEQNVTDHTRVAEWKEMPPVSSGLCRCETGDWFERRDAWVAANMCYPTCSPSETMGSSCFNKMEDEKLDLCLKDCVPPPPPIRGIRSPKSPPPPLTLEESTFANIPPSLCERPPSILCTDGGNGGHRICWKVDGRKLQSNGKQIVSPPFELPFGRNWKPAVFRICIFPGSSNIAKGTRSFKSAGGWGQIVLKCEEVLPENHSCVSFSISVGDGVGPQVSRGPVVHDFSKGAVASFPKAESDWDLKVLTEPDLLTLIVCADVFLRPSVNGVRRKSVEPSERTCLPTMAQDSKPDAFYGAAAKNITEMGASFPKAKKANRCRSELGRQRQLERWRLRRQTHKRASASEAASTTEETSSVACDSVDLNGI